jgi:SAM-dependent methyltransferase
MTLDIGKSYDAVAADYATEFRDELSKKPFDRKMLDWLVEKVGSTGAICDIGCGPGHVANYLETQGAQTFGLDLSVEMVKQARLLNPHIRFDQANMLKLDTIENDSLGGIVAFYSLIHLPRGSVIDALMEFKRVLRNTGALLVAHHIGTEVIHRDEWFGKKVSVDFQFFETEEMKNYIQQSGLILEEVIERDPYQTEYPSRRAYIFARRRDDLNA